jgi:hypothetical protein
MPIAMIVTLVQLAAQLIQTGVQAYVNIKGVISATDLTAIKTALAQAEAASASLRPQVDAALDAAAKK